MEPAWLLGEVRQVVGTESSSGTMCEVELRGVEALEAQGEEAQRQGQERKQHSLLSRWLP